MVKFKKFLSKKEEENQKNKEYIYIDYKSLKCLINKIYVKFRIEKWQFFKLFKQNHEKNQKWSSFEKISKYFPKKLSNSEYNLKIENLKAFARNEPVNEFFSLLNKEINKVYKFYSSYEKIISEKLNHLFLNEKKKDEADSYTAIIDDSEKLNIICLQIKLFQECLITNFEAIRKICKKFDKKLRLFFNDNSFSIFYLKAITEYHNSDINYLLKMQIIEQALIIIQNRISVLFHRKKMLQKGPKKNKLSLNKSNLNYSEEYYLNTEESLKKQIDEYNKRLIEMINDMVHNEKYLITNINTGIYFEYDNEEKNETSIYDYLSLNEYNEDGEYTTEQVNSLNIKENSLSLTRMFINPEEYENMLNLFFYFLNDKNILNIYIIILNSLLNSGFSVIFHVGIIQFHNILGDLINIGILYCIFILGEFISGKLFPFLETYKTWLIFFNTIFSVFIFMNSFIIDWEIANINEKRKMIYTLFLVIFSFLIGMGNSNKPVKKCLMSCLPKNNLFRISRNFILIRKITFYFMVLILYILNYYLKNEIRKKMSICIIVIYSIMSLLVLVLFTDIDSKSFLKYKSNFYREFNQLKFFDSSGVVFEKIAEDLSFSDRNDDLIDRTSLVIEKLKEDEKKMLDIANKEFDELNARGNFNVSNIVQEKTNFLLLRLADSSKKYRVVFLLIFVYFSCLLKQYLIYFMLKNLFMSEDYSTKNLIPFIFAFLIGNIIQNMLHKLNNIELIFKLYCIGNFAMIVIKLFNFVPLIVYILLYVPFNHVMGNKLNKFFAINYLNEKTFFKIKLNSLANFIFYLGKISGCGIFVLECFGNITIRTIIIVLGLVTYSTFIFFENFIRLSKIVMLGRALSKKMIQ